MHLAEFLLKSLQLVFFLKVQFSKFPEKLFNRAPVDSCRLYIEKTCKTLNITSKISNEVLFLGKCEYFTSTDHLHSHYLRTRFRWLLLKFSTIFFTETFWVTVTKRKLLFWQQIWLNCEEKYNLQKFFWKITRRCASKYILHKIKPNRIGKKSHLGILNIYMEKRGIYGRKIS